MCICFFHLSLGFIGLDCSDKSNAWRKDPIIRTQAEKEDQHPTKLKNKQSDLINW